MYRIGRNWKSLLRFAAEFIFYIGIKVNMNSKQFVVVIIFILLSTTIVTATIFMSQVSAQAPPIGLFGNPHDFRTGPPIPSCNADFHQGPPDDTLKGCRETPGR
jgi:hypothetical protein